ncbi:MAG: hypothetical protein HYX78_10160 [Armatimonadetes bacterium]|nr:hypothetical protein [Armatimonadota bacterium]
MVRRNLVAAIVLAVVLIPAMALSQVVNFDLRYDPQKVMTVSGRVLTTIDYNPGNPAAGPQAVIISTPEDRIYTVFLGPGWYLDQTGLKLMRGDAITVTGSLREIVGREYLVVSTIATPTRSFSLRSASGSPLWSARAGVAPPPVGRGPDGVPLIQFDPGQMVSFSSIIETINEVQSPEDNIPVLLAVVRTESPFRGLETTSVLLGPRYIITRRGISLDRGDGLNIMGSYTSFGGRPVVVVTRVSQADDILDLRSMSGVPLWPTALQSPPAIGF